MNYPVVVVDATIVDPLICGSGSFEHQLESLKRNIKDYIKAKGKIPNVIRVSEKGRFGSSIGKTRTVILLDGTKVTVLIIGGEKSSSTHTVGLMGTQEEGTL